MPSSPKIPKDKILETALQLLIRNGYLSLNIKALAQELGCSTQPISWHFKNMEGFRNDLARYALSYANEKMQPHSDNAFEAFTEVGSGYVNIAFDEPNLFKFLFLDGSSGYCIGGLETLCGSSENEALINNISELFGISINDAAEYVGNSIIYSHGILALAVSGVINGDKNQVMQMIDNAGYAFLLKAGANIDYAMKQKNKLGGRKNETKKGEV